MAEKVNPAYSQYYSVICPAKACLAQQQLLFLIKQIDCCASHRSHTRFNR